MGIPLCHSPASDTAAVITIAAVSGVAHEVEQIGFSYDADPEAGAYVQIESPSGTVLQKYYVTKAGPGPVPLGNSCLKGAVGQELIITLTAGASGQSGTINAIQRD